MTDPAASSEDPVISQVTLLDSRTAGPALADLFARKQRFLAEIVGPPLSGRTTALATVAATAAAVWGAPFQRFALIGANRGSGQLLMRAVADLMVKPGAPLKDIFQNDMLVGSAYTVTYRRSRQLPAVKNYQRRQAVEVFVNRLAGLQGEVQGTPAAFKFWRLQLRRCLATLWWLERMKVQGSDPLAGHAAAIADGVQLLETFTAVGLLDEHWAEWKKRERLVEESDVLTGQFYPATDVPLVLLDDADEFGPVRLAAVARIFPRAVVVAAGTAPTLGRVARKFVLKKQYL